MDSITQAALGAAVAEAGMGGRRLGNRAIVWGVVLGTLPDLDVVVYPWLDEASRLAWHRGWSHSLLGITLVSPLLAWLVVTLHRGGVGFARALATVWLVLATHVLIDVFTVYGTMVFLPFSDTRIATNNLFIIDPLFTVPLLAGVVAAACLRKESTWRHRANLGGLAVCTLYAVWSFGAKEVATARFRENLPGNQVLRLMTTPTPFNTLLWRCLAETPEDFQVGYWSLLAPDRPIRWKSLPKNHEALGSLSDTDSLRTLAWFSDGFFGAANDGGAVVVSDWRFGEFFSESGPRAVFSWTLTPDAIEFRRGSVRRDSLKVLQDRLLGRDDG